VAPRENLRGQKPNPQSESAPRPPVVAKMFAFRATEHFLTAPGGGWARIRELVGVDTRSLALFRVLLGITTLWDVCDRMRDAGAHYSDSGAFPRSLAMTVNSHIGADNWPSLYFSGGSEPFVVALMAIHAMLSVSLIVGFRSQLTAALLWMFVYSIQARNVLVGHSGDQLHRMTLFFAAFLPVGECFSIDAVRDVRRFENDCRRDDEVRRQQLRAFEEQLGLVLPETRPRDQRPLWNRPWPFPWSFFQGSSAVRSTVRFLSRPGAWVWRLMQDRTRPAAVRSSADYQHVSGFALALLIQEAVLYYASFYHKSGVTWVETFTATWLSLHLDFFRRPFGSILLGHKDLTIWLTKATKTWQWWASMLMFSPLLTSACRTIAVLGLLTMHASFALSFRLGAFSWIVFASSLGVLPGFFWDQTLGNVFRTTERIGARIVYLRDCRWCSLTARLAGVFLLIPDSQFVAISEGDLGSDEGLVVSVHDGSSSGFPAICELIRLSPLLWPCYPLFLRIQRLEFAAKGFHRHFPGRRRGEGVEFNEIKTKPRTGVRRWLSRLQRGWQFSWVFLASLIGVFVAYAILAQNLHNISRERGVPTSFPFDSLHASSSALMFGQRWSMFAPK
jgi:hypothetical protein